MDINHRLLLLDWGDSRAFDCSQVQLWALRGLQQVKNGLYFDKDQEELGPSFGMTMATGLPQASV